MFSSLTKLFQRFQDFEQSKMKEEERKNILQTLEKFSSKK